jgi:fermentation-respiration switch protein FrsA (DUF1100 family)
MTVERELISEDESVAMVPRTDVSRATIVAYAVVGVILLGWFLFGWLVLQQGFIASVGESVGTGFALLLAVSVVGMARRGRR